MVRWLPVRPISRQSSSLSLNMVMVTVDSNAQDIVLMDIYGNQLITFESDPVQFI